MFGQHFMIKASAAVDDRSGTFSLLDAGTCAFVVLRRMDVLIYSTQICLLSVMEPSPAMTMHEPLSTTHHRDLVVVSPNKNASSVCDNMGVSATLPEDILGST